jgi:hypothetical protein
MTSPVTPSSPTGDSPGIPLTPQTERRRLGRLHRKHPVKQTRRGRRRKTFGPTKTLGGCHESRASERGLRRWRPSCHGAPPTLLA